MFRQFTSVLHSKVWLLVALLGLVGYESNAQAVYPDKPIRIIVPFAPGGGTDQVARTLASGMSTALGQTVIVENKPGAGTVIGTDFVAKSSPDGYTILMATFANAVNTSLLTKLPYGSNKAFTPVVLVGRGPNILVVRADSPFHTLEDLLKEAKAHPQSLTYASQGIGTSAHLAGELFTYLTQTQITHVPYKGAGPAMTDVMGGQVDMTFGTSSAVVKHIQNGRLRALGVTSPERLPALRNIPTIAEQGVVQYSVESWYGLFVPTGTPENIVRSLNEAAKVAVNQPSFHELADNEGLTIVADTPAQFASYLAGEEQRWRNVITQNKIQTD